MSIIAQKWAYSQKLGNATAKAILAFLASHNFGCDQSCFRINTIANALDLSQTAVKSGLIFLAEKGLIKKEARYGDRGERLANQCTLVIPKDYLEKSYSDYDGLYKSDAPVDNSGGVGRQPTGGGSAAGGGVGRQPTPLNTKILNNNLNKSFYNMESENQPCNGKSAETAIGCFQPMEPVDNEVKHDFAGSMDAMASEKRNIDKNTEYKRTEYKRTEMPDVLRQKVKNMWQGST